MRKSPAHKITGSQLILVPNAAARCRPSVLSTLLRLRLTVHARCSPTPDAGAGLSPHLFQPNGTFNASSARPSNDFESSTDPPILIAELIQSVNNPSYDPTLRVNATQLRIKSWVNALNFTTWSTYAMEEAKVCQASGLKRWDQIRGGRENDLMQGFYGQQLDNWVQVASTPSPAPF